MPRRRFITKGRLTATAFVAASVVVVVFLTRTPEPSFGGHSASFWLREITLAANGEENHALEAFNKMGTNSYPVLVRALGGKENPFVRLYRLAWERIPTGLQQRLPKPDEPALLQMSAVVVFQRSSTNQPFPDLYPMLKESDSAVRQAVLNATKDHNPDASQIPLLALAANDPDITVRTEVWRRLSCIGPAATDALPYVIKFCADHDVQVRQDAAWALWQITKQTNAAVPVLEDALGLNQDAGQRHSAAYHLLVMRDSGPAFVTALIDSLTNSQPGDRATVCTFLGQIGPPAAAAIPALRKVLQDPEPEVRRRAEVALNKIEPARAAARSP
jgi:hypothetical protein